MEIEIACEMELYAFVDVSLVVYGVVVYFRCVYLLGLVLSCFVVVKIRVVSFEVMSVFRFELMVVVLVIRLALFIVGVFGLLKFLMVMWSDSLNVLWWFRNRSRLLKTFVANRVSEIYRASSL